MHVGALFLAARSVPRALKVTGLVTGVLFGLSGGLAASAAVTANDVQSAFDRVTRATDGPDALVVRGERSHAPITELRAVDGVETAVEVTSFDVAAFTVGDEPQALGPSADDPCFTGAGDVAATPHTEGWRGRAPQMLLSEGRFPRADAREAVLPAVTARRLDLAVGDQIVFAGDCSHDDGELGEPIAVRISGLGTSVFDGPEVGANFAVENLLISSRLADDLVEHGAEPHRDALVWVDGSGGFSGLSDVPEDWSIALDMVELRDAVHRDLAPDATSLRVFAAIVAVSALIVLGPMLGRQVRAGNATAPTLRALGMSQRSLVAAGLLRGAAVGLVVAIVAAGAMVGLSSRLPIGAARQFEGAVSFSPGAARSSAGALVVAAIGHHHDGCTLLDDRPPPPWRRSASRRRAGEPRRHLPRPSAGDGRGRSLRAPARSARRSEPGALGADHRGGGRRGRRRRDHVQLESQPPAGDPPALRAQLGRVRDRR